MLDKINLSKNLQKLLKLPFPHTASGAIDIFGRSDRNTVIIKICTDDIGDICTRGHPYTTWSEEGGTVCYRQF